MKYHLQSSDHSTVFSRREPGESKLQFKQLQRTASRVKSNRHPKAPRTITEIKNAFAKPEIYNKYALNLRQTRPFYIDTIDDGPKSAFTILASHQMIDLIEEHVAPEEKRYLMDGTFAVVPIGCYYQLLIIHLEFKNDVSCLDSKHTNVNVHKM